MFCGRKYAAYARINAAYRRTRNGVRSTGKKTPIFAYGLQDAAVPSEGTHPVGEGACRKNAHVSSDEGTLFHVLQAN